MHAKKVTRNLQWIVIGILALLAAKFFWPLLVYRLPLGYDVGFYRYLFLTHAEALPPFWIADMDPWAREHSLGLFMFSTILLRAGVPVDWLIGWVWNLFPVALASTLALQTGRRTTVLVGVGTLLAALMSVAYFDGFAAMYWKTFAALLWCVLAFDALERHKWLPASIFGILAVITHNQTGLLFGLVFLAWEILPLLPFSHSTHRPHHGLKKRDTLIAAGVGILIFLCGIAFYWPVFQGAVLQHLPALLGETEASGGSFPPASFYLRIQGILLLFGLYGFWTDMQKSRWTTWQLAVIISALFVFLRLIFYRRFFLQLDFFLLPFAGIALSDLWHRFTKIQERGLIVFLIIVQLFLMTRAIVRTEPIVDDATFDAVLSAGEIVPEHATMLGLENTSVVLLRGWYPDRLVAGPGLFASTWSFTNWERFLLGSHRERVELLQTLPQPTYVFATPFFRSFYAGYADAFLKDSCFERVESTMFYRVTCVP